MQFAAPKSQCANQFEMVDRLLAWGLDATVQVPPWLLTVRGDTADLWGLPVQLYPEVVVQEWVAQKDEYRSRLEQSAKEVR